MTATDSHTNPFTLSPFSRVTLPMASGGGTDWVKRPKFSMGTSQISTSMGLPPLGTRARIQRLSAQVRSHDDQGHKVVVRAFHRRRARRLPQVELPLSGAISPRCPAPIRRRGNQRDSKGQARFREAVRHRNFKHGVPRARQIFLPPARYRARQARYTPCRANAPQS